MKTRIICLCVICVALLSCEDEFLSRRPNPPPRTQGTSTLTTCQYWYRIISDSSATNTNTSQKYIYTTCFDNNQSAEPAQDPQVVTYNGPAYPERPFVGDTYDYTTPDGEYVKYNFTSDRAWEMVERMIPFSVVNTHPGIYAFLEVDPPFNDKVILGPDGLYYSAEANQWHGKKKQ